MRVAVISDVHGNFHALEAVLAAIDRERPDAIWCLGDVVGYGPQPSRCCDLVAAHADVGLVGNHDLGVIGRIDIECFTFEAAYAARWTETVLTPEAREYLESLQPSAELDRAALYHGSPRDPVWDYIETDVEALDAFELAASPLILVGHTHAAVAFGLREELEARWAPGGTEIELGPGERWLLNPGSVGQPRDGDPDAAWLLLDLDQGRASFRRIAYPIEQTQREMLALGLPASLAARLEVGL